MYTYKCEQMCRTQYASRQYKLDVKFPCLYLCAYTFTVYIVYRYVHMCTLCSLAELLCGEQGELICWMAQPPHTRLSSYGGVHQQHPYSYHPFAFLNLSCNMFELLLCFEKVVQVNIGEGNLLNMFLHIFIE